MVPLHCQSVGFSQERFDNRFKGLWRRRKDGDPGLRGVNRVRKQNIKLGEIVPGFHDARGAQFAGQGAQKLLVGGFRHTKIQTVDTGPIQVRYPVMLIIAGR